MNNIWIDSKTTPPPFGERIIVTGGDVCFVVTLTQFDTYVAFDAEGISGYEWETDIHIYDHITHWMPAPKLP